MFIGRKKELEILNVLYKSNKFELVIMSGRRRVGKSTILSKFSNDKPCIFFTAVEGNATLNLDYFNESINVFEGTSEKNYPSFKAALENLFKLSLKERFILIIDEYPYLAKSYKPIASILQLLIDKYKDRSKMMLILSGSSISFMENEVVAYKAPLYGRKTAQLKIEPLSFLESLPYFFKNSNEEKVINYSIFGGTPHYLNQLDSSKSYKDNIINTFLTNISFLNDEPLSLLKQEVSDVNSYYSILTAIANGATKINEISTKTKIEYSNCTKIIKNLVELGLVEKEQPYNSTNSKKSLYKLSDNLFKFWFRFIPSNLSLITRGYQEQAYQKIEPHLNEYIGPIFEDLSKEYLWLLFGMGKSPVNFSDLGRWWGSDSKTKSQIEIDIVGEENKEIALFAECKWTNQKVNSNVLKNLIEKSQEFSHIIKHYYLFSKSGFTDELIELAKQIPNVYLVDLDEMINLFNNKDLPNH